MRSLKRIFGRAVNIACVSMLLAVLSVGVQSQERLINQRSWSDERVKIVEVKLKHMPVKANRKFVAGDDWFNGLTFKVKNTSDEPIVFIELKLTFYKSDNHASTKKRPLSLAVAYGRILPPEGSPVLPDAPAPVLPGSDVNIVFDEDNYEVVKFAHSFHELRRARAAIILQHQFDQRQRCASHAFAVSPLTNENMRR